MTQPVTPCLLYTSRDDNDGMDDLDRLWKEFSELLHGATGRDRKEERRHPDLRSRDDFSRDDVDAVSYTHLEVLRRQDPAGYRGRQRRHSRRRRQERHRRS